MKMKSRNIKYVKTLKDHALSGSKRSSTQNFSSPPVWWQSLPLQEAGSVVSDDSSPVIQEDNSKPRIAWMRGDR